MNIEQMLAAAAAEDRAVWQSPEWTAFAKASVQRFREKYTCPKCKQLMCEKDDKNAPRCGVCDGDYGDIG